MKIIGIDNSVNSPGVVWFKTDNNLKILEKNYFGFTQVKKRSSEKIHFYKKKNFKSNVEQYITFRDLIFDKIFVNNVDDNCFVAFEDYAYAANGKVFNIAESTAALKIKFYQNNIPIRLYDPASIKKFATNFGNADKVRMKDTYDELPNEKKLVGNVNEDIIDAYFITEFLHCELMLRRGLISLKDLSNKKIEIFNRCTKTYPENILVRPFIEKDNL